MRNNEICPIRLPHWQNIKGNLRYLVIPKYDISRKLKKKLKEIGWGIWKV